MRTPSKLLPDVDYTIDGGKIILTESFLLRRGFCCNTRCRHCPYKGERASAPIVILGLPKASPAMPSAGLPASGGSPTMGGAARMPAPSAAAPAATVTIPLDEAKKTA